MSALANRGSVDRTDARRELAQAVMHLDWRVSSLTETLSLTDRQIPTVRMILANAMASCLASRNGSEHRDGLAARERLEALLSREQRARLAALSRQQRELLVLGLSDKN